MSSRLNSEAEEFEEFDGENIIEMPKLIAEGRIPLSVSELMKKRLEVRNDPNFKSAWLNIYIDTGDAIVYHPDGRVKIILDSQYLREITPETPKKGDALILTFKQYDEMPGKELKKKALRKNGFPMLKKNARVHPIWKILARDQYLLEDYVNCIFSEGKERYGYDEAMGVFVDSTNQNTPEMKMLCVKGIGSMRYVNCRSSLVSSCGRLVGVVPKIYTPTDLDNFDNAMEGLEGIINPELLKPFITLRGKL